MKLTTLAVLLLLPLSGFAQLKGQPVKSEVQLKQELFELEEHQFNHSFKAALPGDNFLLIDFYKWSYWPDTSALHSVFEIAALAAKNAEDSLNNPLTSKRIDVHIPVKNKPITMRLVDHDDGSDMLILNYGQQSPLKLGMDTIRILKTVNIDGEDKDERGEILFTFILKDFRKMVPLAENKTIINDVANTFDEQVNKKREKWNREDTWYHDIHISYSPEETEQEKKLIVENKGGFLKGFDAKYYVGATLFRNTIAPMAEMGFSYKWPSSIGEYAQVRISASSMGHFERINESTFNYYNTVFANIEWGTLVNKSGTVIPIYETSLGMGYMFSDHPSLRQHKAMKLFWHYSLSPSVRITPEFYILFRENQDNYVWAGLTIALRVL